VSMDDKTIFAWRPAPFGRIRKVPPFEARRWPEYQRKPHATAKRRDWTHDQVDELHTLLDAGHDYPTIARRLGRSINAIVVKTQRLHCKMTTRPTVLTAREAARIAGVGCAKTIVYWIGLGWLPGKARRTLGKAPRRIWAIQYDDLVACLRDRTHWMAYDAACITDEELRAELVAQRAGQPRWLTHAEVAARYGVDRDTVGNWIQRGYLPSQRYGNHWIWSADLDGWVIPSERSRKGIPRSARRVVAGGDMLRAA
jgi:excisionase family DNA binding protein